MTRPNREWKSFSQRWNGFSRFEKFLPPSVLVHLGLVVLIGLPVYSAYEKQQQLAHERQEQQQAEQKQEREQAAEQAKEEVKTLLQEEVAQEQLKPFFDELTREFLDPKTAEEYWKELLEELGPELAALMQQLEDPDGFDPLEAEKMIQELKERLVQELAELVERKQLEPLRQELLAQAKALAKQLAETYRKELAEKVGQPIGEQMRQLVQTEAAAAQAALEKTDRDLASALQAARQAQKDLQTAEGRLPELRKRQAQAEAAPKKDTQALAEVRKGVTEQRGELLAAGKLLDQAKAALKTAGDQLTPHMPRAGEQVKSAETGTAAAAQKARDSAASAQQGKLDDAAKMAQVGKESVQKTIESIERVRAAVQLQLAANQADRTAREAAALARTAGELSREQAEAARKGDASQKARLDRETAAAEKRAAEAQASAEQLAQRLAQADRAVQEAAKGSSPEAKKLDAQGRLDQARAELKQGQGALAERSAAKAADKLGGAAQHLEALRKDIRAAQERVGLAGENQAEALAQKLDELRRQKLAEHVRQKFEQDFKDKALPGLMNRVKPVVAKRLQGDAAATEQFKEAVQKELQRILGQELPAQVRAGERFAESAGERMRDQAAGPPSTGKPTPRVMDLTTKAEAAARTLADRQVPAIVAAGVKDAPVGVLAQGKASSKDAGQASLLRQLEIFRNQLTANRRDFLGRPDATRLAALRRRHQDRMSGLSRLGDYDVPTEAYRKLVQTLKERGQLTGEEILRQGASGEKSTAEEQAGPQPRFIAAPDLSTEETPASPERKDEPAKPREIRFAPVPFLADDAIKIDGDLADWKGVAPLSLDLAQVGSKRKRTEADAMQTAYLAYSPRGLLVAVDVVDTSGKLDDRAPLAQFWLNDCLEVYIDTLNTKYSRRGEMNTHQFFAFPFEHRESPGIGGFESKCTTQGQRVVWEEPVPHRQDLLPRVGKKTEKGWTIEMLIPRTLLRRGEMQPGRILGFNLQIDVGHLDRYYYWTCLDGVKTSEHPNVWGDIQLLGSDAKIELVGADGKETLRAIVPGQPVRVRVTDPDMNLDERKKDKVSVTLRAASGESETLILEETEVSSGVFVGALASRLNIGSRQPSTLQVFEGEKVTAEYIDQVRRTPERNVPVRASFAVSSIGTQVAE